MLLYSTVYAVIAAIFACAVFLTVATVNPELLMNYIGSISEIEGINEAIPSSWIYLIGTVSLSVPWYVSYPLIFLAVILNGPLTCGITYCMRNHAREEHVWGTDMFVRAWRNKWQGLVIGIIDATVLFGIVIYAFGSDTLGMTNEVFVYLKFMSYFIGLIWFIMRIYIYQMIVTFNLKLRGLLKNAWMFVIIGFGRNLLALLCIALISALFILFPLYYPATMPFFLVCMMTIFWGVVLFLAVFITYPVMHRCLVAPALKEQKRADALKRRSELRARKAAGETIDEEELSELEDFLEQDEKKSGKTGKNKKKNRQKQPSPEASEDESSSEDGTSEEEAPDESENEEQNE
ncbi:MAG: hypothetical protein ACI4XQ_08175 [Eubacteriales bacterium]